MKKEVKKKPLRKGKPAKMRGAVRTEDLELGTENLEQGTGNSKPGVAVVERDSSGRFKKREAGPVKAKAVTAAVDGTDKVDEEAGALSATDQREMEFRVNRSRSQVQLGNEGKAEADAPERNPLLDLPEEKRAKLFAWLRECPYEDAVQHVLKDEGIGEVTPMQLSEFFQSEAEFHWERRIERAAVEANALVQLVERSPVQFSSGILAALGQEAFRQVASGEVEPESMGKMAMLFLRARSAERADQMQVLKREKMRREMEGQVEQALEKLAEEVEQHPAARAAFEALRREIYQDVEGEKFDGINGITKWTKLTEFFWLRKTGGGKQEVLRLRFAPLRMTKNGF
jgi:hypothetical protein